jgi:hypothetical protein
MSRRTAAWFAWSLWTLCIAFAAFAVLLAINVPPGPTKNNSNWGVVIAVSLLTYPTIGAFIASRRPENPIGWILCGVGLRFVVEGFALVYVGYALPVQPASLPGEKLAFWVAGWFDFPIVFLALVLMILLFPDGRLPSRSWRAVPWVAAGGSVLWTFMYVTARNSPMNWFFGLSPSHKPFVAGNAIRTFFEALGTLSGLALLGIGIASVISLILRWDNARGDDRQQIKWFTYAAAVLIGVPLLVAPFVGMVAESMGGSWEVGLARPILAGLLGIPVAVGIAILKYRLYDIDIIINRTLVYGSLTLTLALVYFGGVTATQALFRTLASQQELPQLVVVASTLVIAALFTPMRRRIQSLIDRSFYRSKYDARKTLEEFSTTLRNETNLEALNEELVGVVRVTMQPAHVSLWLRPRSDAGLGRKSHG